MIVDILFKEGDGPDLIFVEVEDENGGSVDIGKWFRSDDGYHALKLNVTDVPRDPSESAEIQT